MKQILYLLGPVGGKVLNCGTAQTTDGTNALVRAENLGQRSPLACSTTPRTFPLLESQCGIAPRYLQRVMSPWAVKTARGMVAATYVNFALSSVFPFSRSGVPSPRPNRA
jgi:predicted Ser/Thr protein kinase